MRGVVWTFRRHKFLLISDTHVGYEVELRRQRGINVISQTDKLVEAILELVDLHNVTSLVILGDVKHELPVPRESTAEVRQFLERLSKKIPVLLLPGNHDSLLQEIAAGINGVEIAPTRGILIKDVLLFHGHVKPSKEDLEKARVVVMGHTHPAVVIRDEVGYAVKEPAVLKIRASRTKLCKALYNEPCGRKGEVKIIVLPASHPLITGVDVREVPAMAAEGRTFLKYVEWQPEKVEVYLTDLTYLGTLEDLALTSP
ncbi:MAG: metallophosphoesterase [Pyrobaculum sp.]